MADAELALGLSTQKDAEEFKLSQQVLQNKIDELTMDLKNSEDCTRKSEERVKQNEERCNGLVEESKMLKSVADAANKERDGVQETLNDV